MAKIDPKYTTAVTVTGGREGHAVSEDGVLDVQLRRPKTNGVNTGTNPEQLFAAAWGGCIQSALMAVARNAGQDVSNSTVKVEVAQGPAVGWHLEILPRLGGDAGFEIATSCMIVVVAPEHAASVLRNG